MRRLPEVWRVSDILCEHERPLPGLRENDVLCLQAAGVCVLHALVMMWQLPIVGRPRAAAVQAGLRCQKETILQLAVAADMSRCMRTP